MLALVVFVVMVLVYSFSVSALTSELNSYKVKCQYLEKRLEEKRGGRNAKKYYC